eukprot:1579473-Rhodomonas_salina.2
MQATMWCKPDEHRSGASIWAAAQKRACISDPHLVAGSHAGAALKQRAQGIGVAVARRAMQRRAPLLPQPTSAAPQHRLHLCLAESSQGARLDTSKPGPMTARRVRRVASRERGERTES